MTKLFISLFLLLFPLTAWAEDYWVYIKDREEIVSSARIAGTSQKGDIVEIIPCKRLGKNEPSELEKKEWLIVKVSDITEEERNRWLASYTDGKEDQPTILAYRKHKIDVDTYKTAQRIDSKTRIVPVAVSKVALDITEKTVSDIDAMMREARLYDRTMPVRKLVKWGWEKILSPAYAANTSHTVITTGGGDYTTLNAYEDAIDGTAYSAGETATVNCSGTSADTTAVTFSGWDTDVTIVVNGDYAVTSGVHWSTSYYRLETTATTLSIYHSKVQFNKIQAYASNVSNYVAAFNFGFHSSGVSDHRMNRCIAKTNVSNNWNDRKAVNLSGSASAVSKIYNCVIYSSNFGIKQNGGTAEIYNCTIYDCSDDGINEAAGTATIYNCAVFNNTDDFANVGGSIDHCASDDADGTNSVDLNENAGGEWTNAFVSYSTYDFHVKDASSAVYNTGTDLYASGVTTDIDGDTLTVRNDIGADEYVSATPPAGRRRIIIISKHENTIPTRFLLSDCYIRRKVSRTA